MSITIATPVRRYVIKADDTESERLFNMLLMQLVAEDKVSYKPKRQNMGEESKEQIEPLENESHEQSVVSSADSCSVKDTAQKYKGFLYIRCKNCGQVHGFCSKHELSYYRCPDCGNKMDLTDPPLVPMRLNCECGKYSRYMTNMDEAYFDVNCINCGSPVPVRYNSKKKVFETIM